MKNFSGEEVVKLGTQVPGFFVRGGDSPPCSLWKSVKKIDRSIWVMETIVCRTVKM